MDETNEPNEPKKARRVRYSGTHPKAFKEKYKELQAENYSDDIAKVIAQGRTPAGMHRSICVNEILEVLNIQPGQIGLDATLGYGGHSAAMIKCLIPGGKLYALDVDSIEMPKTKERLLNMGYGEDVIDIRKMNFASADLLVYEAGPMDFVLADLGVSSMQIDNPERGFSFKIEGPLDLRLNPSNGKSAAMLLKTITEKELEEILITNADEPNARLIAKSIIDFRTKNEPIETTTQLQQIIKDALPKNAHADEVKKACQRSFQALRIEVNEEFKVLDKFLEKLPFILKPGGRVAILSFHSGEDRRVKKSFQNFERQGVYSSISPDCIRPTVEECATNPRAKSTKMRWAVKGLED
jgi:16S rRNA (cytosine1402-N4)-methyltransferase